LHATLQTATRAGYLLIFMDTANDRDHQSHALATLRDHQVDALLVIAPDLIAYRPVEPMSTIPTILVNCVDPGAGVASIVPDEHGAGSAAARVLIEAGHTHIGVVAGPRTRCRIGCISRAFSPPRSRRTSPSRYRRRPTGTSARLRRGSHAARRTRHADGTHLHSRAASSRCPARGRRSWVRHSSRPVDLSASRTVSCSPRDLSRR
jgi:DNA-binding LacI/PurR family transcriptional regulator